MFINGKQTQKINPQGNDNLWRGGQCGPNPTLMFRMGVKFLGNPTNRELIIHPMVGNNVNNNVRYNDPKIKNMKLSVPVPLNNLRRKVGGGPFVNVPGLPKGKYLFIFHVDGQKGWDEQHIFVHVN